MPDIAASLQTLAEKIANTIYRAAKVCSYQSASADKLLLYHGKDTFFFPPSIHLMYKDWYLILIQSRLNDLSINDRFIILSNKMS